MIKWPEYYEYSKQKPDICFKKAGDRRKSTRFGFNKVDKTRLANFDRSNEPTCVSISTEY